MVKDEDVAYTILLCLGEKYSPLVVTMTNMSSSTSPLSLVRVCEQVLTEELRLRQFNSNTNPSTPRRITPLHISLILRFVGIYSSVFCIMLLLLVPPRLRMGRIHTLCVQTVALLCVAIPVSGAMLHNPTAGGISSLNIPSALFPSPLSSALSPSPSSSAWTQQQQHHV